MPAGLLEQIVEYRNYAASKAAYDADPRAEGDAIQLVRIIAFELVQEEIAKDRHE